jgi:uncharacterized protein YcbK (DUF882 family)
MNVRRISLIRGAFGALVGSLSPLRVRSTQQHVLQRVLWLQRAGYDEEVRIAFCLDGQTVYEPGYREICWLLRDHRVAPSEGYVRFDIVTIEAMWEVQETLRSQGIDRPIVVTSGYRTPATNAATEGAARNSQHLFARAVDIVVDGVSMERLFDACWSRKLAGGVGYYDTHVHLDSGARRWWVGEAHQGGVDANVCT